MIVTVEFPAVLLNTSNGDIEDEFHYYVQPQENPVLSEFCKDFTGITQVSAHTCNVIINVLVESSSIALIC